jgi:hypothetical protein
MRKLIVGGLIAMGAIVGTASMAAATVYEIVDRAGNSCGAGGVDDGHAGVVTIVVDACID